MFLTEGEAREKYCLKIYRYTDKREFGFCLTSSCMFWRWQSGDSKKGYCGLAGVPLSNMSIEPEENIPEEDEPPF